MKKGKVFFHPIDGAGPLTISWCSRPKGDAIEAKKGSGVGFFSETGELLCVIFDEVKSKHDHQFLEFDHVRIEVSIKQGQITQNILSLNKASPRLRRKRSQRQIV